MKGSGRSRGGVPAFLTLFRVLFNSPFSRVLMRGLAARAGADRSVSVAYAALALLTGDKKYSCLLARFYSVVLDLSLGACARWLGGRPEDVRQAVADPAVRRGLALVLEGLARYGVTIPQRLPAPFLVVWNFTNACNLRCAHCYQRAGGPSPDELALEEKLDLVRQLDRAGVAAVAFSEGEPTVHPDLLRVVSEASSAGMYTALATNGIRLADRGYAEKLKKAGLNYVEVSIDSADPDKHDKFRGVRGAWEKAVKGLKNAIELGFFTGIATTVTKLNVDEIDEILDLAEELGVDRVVFFNFVPVGRGERISSLDLSPEERESPQEALRGEH